MQSIPMGDWIPVNDSPCARACMCEYSNCFDHAPCHFCTFIPMDARTQVSYIQSPSYLRFPQME